MSNKTLEFQTTLISIVEKIGLMIIAIATVFASGIEIKTMIFAGTVTLADLLLLFIYLEVLAMVNHYFHSGQLPVRFPLYIAIVALARYLILDIKAMEDWRILAIAGAILVLACAVLVIRFGHVNYPYKEWRSKTLRGTDKQAGEE